MRNSLVVAVALVGCRSDQGLVAPDEVRIDIETPSYGAFLGDGPIEVTGTVSPSTALVKVDGEPVVVDAQGRFSATLAFADRYHIVDVQASAGPVLERVRVPVFDGRDPRETWPGGISLRLTPEGLDRIGAALGGVIDATGWGSLLSAALPGLDVDGFALTPVGVSHAPTEVDLVPTEAGIDTLVVVDQLSVDYELAVDLFGYSLVEPVSVGFGEVVIGAVALPSLDADGQVIVTLTDATIDLADPEIVLGDLDAQLFEDVIELVSDDLVEPLADLVLDAVLGAVGVLPVGGPFQFGTELGGMPLEVRLAEVYADPAGLGGDLAVGIGEPAPAEVPELTAPGLPSTDPMHATLGLHEAVLHELVASELVDALTQEIDLGGALGELIGAGITNLPGGETAPVGEGFCLSLAPQPARVVRMQAGTDPLATAYMPDVAVDVSVLQNGACIPWLQASVAAEVGLVVRDGSTLGIEVEFVDGAVMYYGATTDWEEGEVIAGLNAFLGGATSLLGGMAEIDLADLGGFSDSEEPLAAGLGDVEPRIVASEPLPPVEGMYTISLQLWD